MSVISAPCVELADVCTAATLPSWGPLFSNCGESYDANRGICVMFAIMSSFLVALGCNSVFFSWNSFYNCEFQYSNIDGCLSYKVSQAQIGDVDTQLLTSLLTTQLCCCFTSTTHDENGPIPNAIQWVPSITEMLRANSVPFLDELHERTEYRSWNGSVMT